MTRIGLFYGSSKGSTEGAAMRIKKEFNTIQSDLVTVINVADGDLSTMADYDKIILGSSTWDDGQLQEDWRDVFDQMDSQDLSGKQVAVFGFGDQYEFPGTFQCALGILAKKARERGAELVGLWPTQGYKFEHSEGLEDGSFLGLALDSANQYEMTRKRIKAWVQQLAREFELVKEASLS
jgi:flavodoxin I